MPLSPDKLSRTADRFQSFVTPLQKCFARMDQAYETIAAAYGFRCNGCDESCCRTRFYHHTYVEYLYLFKGFASQTQKMQAEIRTKAGRYVDALVQAANKGIMFRSMCPLNFNGRCSLYAHRPMICRLHGIPHELHPPGRGVAVGPGCDMFQRKYGHADDIAFDRTPHYAEMAALEKEFRQAEGLSGRIKMTIAEMILQF
jgi:Fe-S-cluster containining protein